MVGVQFRLDGSDLGAEDISAPFSISWDSTNTNDGSHTLTAVARDAAGNTGTSSGVGVSVSNGTSNDTTPPSVSITSPSSGATVSGTVTVSANASDNVAVAGVQFKVNGANIGAEDITAPYSVSLDTINLANGSHTLTAEARDTANNATVSAPVTITVNNQGGTPASATITLQPTQAKQTWIAWRGEVTGPQFGATANDEIPPAVMSQILDALVNDLGLNGLRFVKWKICGPTGQNIELTNDNANPFSIDTTVFFPEFDLPCTPPGEYWAPLERINKVVIPMRNRVLANGEQFSLYMSTIGSSYSNFQPFHHSDSEEFAEWIEAAVLWFENRAGFLPDLYALLNEPSPEWIINGPNELISHAEAVGNRFVSRGWNTKIQYDEAVVPDELGFLLPCGPSCQAHVGLLSYHGYDYNGVLMPTAAGFSNRNMRRDTAATWGVQTAMTEICCKGISGHQWNGSYDQGLQVARDIYWNMTEGDIAVWEQLDIMGTCADVGCPEGSTPINLHGSNLSDWFRLPVYYARRQYGKWIRPGYVRVETTCTGCTNQQEGTFDIGASVKAVAFKRPDGSYVAVVINDHASAATIRLAGFPAGTYQIEGIDPTVCSTIPGDAGVRDRCTPTQYVSQMIGSGQDLVLNVAAKSIVTFH